HPGSVGRAAPTVELRVVDDQGHDTPAGERGEIWIKGPTVMAHGYWRRPDANAAAFTDGWFHTGDIGSLDADGVLYLVDRAKDMIIRGGAHRDRVDTRSAFRSWSTRPGFPTIPPWSPPRSSVCRTTRSARRSRRSCSCGRDP